MNHRSMIVCLLLLLFSVEAYATSELVYLYKAMDDNAIIVRRNGDAYQIEKGVGCLSLWRFEGKAVLVTSPGLILGAGSELMLPDVDQKCRIWNSSLIGSIDEPRTKKEKAPKQHATACEEGHWIQSISSNGEIIKLENGSIWQVDGVDKVTSSIWLPVSNITVCGSYLINTDDGEKVGATRVK